MSSPKVSIIMPVYNAAAYVGSAIASALSQTGVSLELIVVDDGSTDASAEAVRAAAAGDDRVRLIQLERNTGMPGIVRNAGAKVARGEYLAFLDADDVYLPERLSASCGLLDRWPEVSTVFSDHFRNGERNPRPESLGDPHLVRLNFVNAAGPALVPKAPGLYWTTPRFFGYMCLSGIPMCTDTVTIRRDVFDKAGGFSETLRYNQDEDLWFRVAMSTTIAYTTTPLARVWRRDDSHTGDRRRADAMKKWDQHYRTNVALHEGNYARGASLLTPDERRAYRHLIAARWIDLAYTCFLAEGARSRELDALVHAWRWMPSMSVARMFVRALAPGTVRARFRARAMPTGAHAG